MSVNTTDSDVVRLTQRISELEAALRDLVDAAPPLPYNPPSFEKAWEAARRVLEGKQ